MRSLVKALPLPIVGLMLALAGAGNLISSYGEVYKTILGLISASILFLIILKMILHPNIIKGELNNPVVASVFPTFTMGIMLLSTYIRPSLATISFLLWIGAVVGHIILIFKFSFDHLLKFDINKVFPSWFIVYVGIVVASVTAPAFQMETLGRIVFWIGLISYFLIFPLVVRRVSIKAIPDQALPTLVIFAAPVALCLAGYMNSFEVKNNLMVWGLLIISQVNYIFVLGKLPKLLKLKFYPSFSGFTFPLVISAISIKLTRGYFIEIARPIPLLKYLVAFEEILAIVIVIYVLIRYIGFMLRSIELEEASPV